MYKAILKDWKEHAYDLVAVKTVKGMAIKQILSQVRDM